MPGEADRWNPITLNGTLAGETMTAPPIVGSFTVPIFEEDGTTLAIELPLQAFEVQMATMSADRNCVGLRTGPAYDNTQGSIRTYMTVADAMARRLVVGPIDNDLCSFTANITGRYQSPDIIIRSPFTPPSLRRFTISFAITLPILLQQYSTIATALATTTIATSVDLCSRPVDQCRPRRRTNPVFYGRNQMINNGRGRGEREESVVHSIQFSEGTTN